MFNIENIGECQEFPDGGFTTAFISGEPVDKKKEMEITNRTGGSWNYRVVLVVVFNDIDEHISIIYGGSFRHTSDWRAS